MVSPGRGRVWRHGRTLVAVFLCALAGSALVSPRRSSGGWRSSAEWTLAAAAGLAVCVPIVFAAALLWFPVAPVFAAVSLAVAAAGLVIRRLTNARASSAPETVPAAESSRVSGFLLVLALALFAAKVVSVPLWSWDHFVVWGMKARAMLAGGYLDLDLLRLPPYCWANADYPLGLPVLWRVLTLGEEPGAADFRLCHVLFGLGVALLVRRILVEAGAEQAIAGSFAAWAAVSPIFWDTETLGLAEMPLAFFALAGLGLLLRNSSRPTSLAGGLVLGFLPWIKKEGLSLALLLYAASWQIGRSRSDREKIGPGAFRLSGLALGAWAGAALAVERRLLPPGGSLFFAGPWPSRVRLRVIHPGALAAAIGREVFAREWHGFWAVFLAAFAAASAVRASRILPLFAVVLGQGSLYVAVYFATALDPVAHIETSLFRILGALVPLGAVAVGLTVAGRARPPPLALSLLQSAANDRRGGRRERADESRDQLGLSLRVHRAPLFREPVDRPAGRARDARPCPPRRPGAGPRRRHETRARAARALRERLQQPFDLRARLSARSPAGPGASRSGVRSGRRLPACGRPGTRAGPRAASRRRGRAPRRGSLRFAHQTPPKTKFGGPGGAVGPAGAGLFGFFHESFRFPANRGPAWRESPMVPSA